MSLSGHEHKTWVSDSPQALPTLLVRFCPPWPPNWTYAPAWLLPEVCKQWVSPQLTKGQADNAHASSLYLVLLSVPGIWFAQRPSSLPLFPAASDVLAKQRPGQFFSSVVLLTRALFITFPDTVWSYMNKPYNWTHIFVPLVENGPWQAPVPLWDYVTCDTYLS